jgi:hypothetical protein
VNISIGYQRLMSLSQAMISMYAVKRVIRVCLICILSTSIIWLYFALAAPAILFKETVVDVGSVAQGQTVQHDFIFVNNGLMTLTLRDVNPGCACSAEWLSAKSVKSGQSGILRVSLNTAVYSNFMSHEIRMGTNDPRHRVVILSLRGWVRPEFTLSRNVIELDTTAQPQERAEELIVIAHGRSRVISARATDPRIRIRQDEEAVSKRFRVLITAMPTASASSVGDDGTIVILTSSTTTPEIRVPVRERGSTRLGQGS